MNQLVLPILALTLGFVVLTISADKLVEGASALAIRLGISPLVVGLTIVAFATSAPELVVGVQAVLDGFGGLAIGNIVGSNIANVFLVLGVPAIIAPIAAAPAGATRNAVIGLAAAGLLVSAGVLNDNTLTWPLGALLFGLIIAYVTALLVMRSPADAALTNDLPDGAIPLWKSLLFVVAGPVGLMLGGSLIVGGGSTIASEYGVSDAVIGLTIVAIGTSLPELAATGVAALRRETELAIGNVLGSNIFNILAVGGMIGLAGRFTPQGSVALADEFLRWHFPLMIVAAVTLLVITATRQRIGRRIGVVFLVGYLAYLGLLAQTSSAV